MLLAIPRAWLKRAGLLNSRVNSPGSVASLVQFAVTVELLAQSVGVTVNVRAETYVARVARILS